MAEEADARPTLPRKIVAAFFLCLLIVGLVLYVGWAMLYNKWTDIGLYSVTIVIIMFGLFGVLLYGKERE